MVSVNNQREAELVRRFMDAVDYLNRQMHTCGLDDWEGLDMTIPQIKTLVLLERSGPLRMGNIAGFLNRALSATTTVVDRLVEKGLIDRTWDPSDRRVVICRLTDQGTQAMEGFWEIRRERLQLMADILEVEQMEVVVQGLELMRMADKKIQESAIAMQP
jgi:DNA-binding MarR family transcriptional regulator